MKHLSAPLHLVRYCTWQTWTPRVPLEPRGPRSDLYQGSGLGLWGAAVVEGPSRGDRDTEAVGDRRRCRLGGLFFRGRGGHLDGRDGLPDPWGLTLDAWDLTIDCYLGMEKQC